MGAAAACEPPLSPKRRIEVVSKPRVTPEGKAQADSKAQSACDG
jgi:hypothetical protein